MLLRVTAQSGPNAVLSGLFFGAGTPASAGSANFVNLDTTTSGAWGTMYGSDAQDIIGDALNNPTYGAIATDGVSYVWAAATSDPRALTELSPLGPGNIASAIYGDAVVVDLWCTDNNPHQVAIYALDWDLSGRSEQADLLDGATGAVLDTEQLSSFGGGTYAVWSISGHVKLRVTSLSGTNAVVMAVFSSEAPAGHPSRHHSSSVRAKSSRALGRTANCPWLGDSHHTRITEWHIRFVRGHPLESEPVRDSSNGERQWRSHRECCDGPIGFVHPQRHRPGYCRGDTALVTATGRNHHRDQRLIRWNEPWTDNARCDGERHGGAHR